MIAVEFCRGPADGMKEISRGRLEVTMDPSKLPFTVERAGQTYALTEIRIYIRQNAGKAIYTLDPNA